MGRGDRTLETDENRRTTVGVDLHSHKLRNGTECKIYDVAGQVLSGTTFDWCFRGWPVFVP